MHTAPAACRKLVRAIQHKPHDKHEQHHLQACHNLHSYHDCWTLCAKGTDFNSAPETFNSQSNACRLSYNERSCTHRLTTDMYKCLNSGSQRFGTVLIAAFAWVSKFRQSASNMHQQCDLRTSDSVCLLVANSFREN